MSSAALDIDRLRGDPVAFISELIIDPETNRPFSLYPAEALFLRKALTPTADGSLPFLELVFSAPKKSGKTALGAMAMLYVIVALGGPYAEGYCLANDRDQAKGRVFRAISRMVESSPTLKASATVLSDRIEFPSTGSFIQAIASDYAGEAGGNPTFIVFDELWAYVSERSFRLWDELVPVPTRRVSARLTVTYAGFEDESTLLEGLYKRGLEGQEIGPDLRAQPGLLMYWTHTPPAPWQTRGWLEQIRRGSRPAAFIRQYENRFVTSESTFVDLGWWDGCVSSTPVVTDRTMSVWVGVDASVKRDSSAVVACTWDEAANRVRMISHRIFQPTREAPLDFEETIEKAILDLRQRFAVREVRYDPYQMASTAQRLTKKGVPMVEFPQSMPNLTAASQNLFELIQGRNLVAYPDPVVRKAIGQAVAVEGARGWRIAKEKQSHKIDVVVALAQAALGAVERGINQSVLTIAFYRDTRLANRGREGHDESVYDVAARMSASNPAFGRHLDRLWKAQGKVGPFGSPQPRGRAQLR